METKLTLNTEIDYKNFSRLLSKELKIPYNTTLDGIAKAVGYPNGWNELKPKLSNNRLERYTQLCVNEEFDHFKDNFNYPNFHIPLDKSKEVAKLLRLPDTDMALSGQFVQISAWIPSEDFDEGVLDIGRSEAKIIKNANGEYQLVPRNRDLDIPISFYNILHEKIIQPLNEKIIKPSNDHIHAVGIIFNVMKSIRYKENVLHAIKLVSISKSLQPDGTGVIQINLDEITQDYLNS